MPFTKKIPHLAVQVVAEFRRSSEQFGGLTRNWSHPLKQWERVLGNKVLQPEFIAVEKNQDGWQALLFFVNYG